MELRMKVFVWVVLNNYLDLRINVVVNNTCLQQVVMHLNIVNGIKIVVKIFPALMLLINYNVVWIKIVIGVYYHQIAKIFIVATNYKDLIL